MSPLVQLAARVAELERRQSALLTLARVSALDAAAARVRVQIGALQTDWLPWLTHHAGTASAWHAPAVGEQVLVCAPSGNLALGAVLPALYSTANPPPETDAAKTTLKFADGAVLEYDRAAHKLKATVPGPVEVSAQGDITAQTQQNAVLTTSGNVTVTAGAAVTIDAPATTITGTLTVQGALAAQAGMSITGGSGGVTATINGSLSATGDLSADGDTTAGGVSLKNHVHKAQGSTANTTAPLV
jgi:phage baseplate assembly protein V